MGVLYAEREAPRMGALRDSMKRNPNIQKPWLGRTKTAAQKLPGEGFVYGCQVPHGLGVADVIVHLENVPPDKAKFLGPDYEAMNKLAADMAVKTSAEMTKFREAHPISRAPSKPLNCGNPLPSDKDKNHVYGKAPDKLSPIADVINNKFGDEWIQMNLHYQKEKPDFDDEGTRRQHWKLAHPRPTKSYTLSKNYWAVRMTTPAPKPRFCMHRFRNIPKKIDCWNPTPLKRDDDVLEDLDEIKDARCSEVEETPKNFIEFSNQLTRTKGQRALPCILRKLSTSGKKAMGFA